MKNNRSIKRRGFTLVELLIVIVVIGVLSAMMMLSSTEAVSSAKASNIISNLRNLKTAALAMYVDNMDAFDNATALPTTGFPTGYTDWRSVLIKYLNAGGSSNTVDTNYEFKITDGKWYVYMKSVGDSRVSEKLAGRASSVGLLNGSGTQFKATDDECDMLVQESKATAASSSTPNT